MKVNLDVLKEQIDADYLDGDIVVIDGLKEVSVEGSLQMDMIIVLICTSGRLQVDINGTTYMVNTHDMVVCPPNVYLNNYMLSPDFDSKIIGLSYNALQRLLHVNKDIWDMMLLLVKHPIFHIDPMGLEQLDNYYSLLTLKLKDDSGRFRREVMHALFQAIFYEICEKVMPLVMEENEQSSANMKQGDVLMKRFIKLLADSQGRERSVSDFAEKLCVTPKYLSSVCRMSSGKTALEWIHEYTIEAIVQQLKYTDKTVKEIADELQFPNISFFGKFVKGHLGVSPLAYRKRLAKQS